jgi:uncharacterized membrane protein YgcG
MLPQISLLCNESLQGLAAQLGQAWAATCRSSRSSCSQPRSARMSLRQWPFLPEDNLQLSWAAAPAPADLVCICPIAGEFPWVDEEAGGAGSSTSATHHYARQYYQKLSQLLRSREERELLHTEVLRAFNCLEERQATIQESLAALAEATTMPDSAGGDDAAGSIREESGAVDAGVAGSDGDADASGEGGSSEGGGGSSSGPGGCPWTQLLAAGRAAMLQIQLRRLELIYAEASRRLTKYRV